MDRFCIRRFFFTDHGERLGLGNGKDMDCAFLVLYLYLIPDMETEGFQPFPLHGDFRGVNIGAVAEYTYRTSGAGGIGYFDAFGFHVVYLLHLFSVDTLAENGGFIKPFLKEKSGNFIRKQAALLIRAGCFFHTKKKERDVL